MFIIKEGTEGGKDTSPELRQSIIDWLNKEGHTVRTAAEDESYLKAHTQEEIDKVFRERNQQLEDTIKEVTGVEKASPEEKYYDYFTRAMKDRQGAIKTLEEKVKTFEKAGTEGSDMAKEYKRQLDTLQENFKSTQEELTGKIKTMEQEHFQANHRSSIEKAISELNIKDMDESIKQDVIDARIAKFNSTYKPKNVDGVIMYDKDGKPALNKQDGKPYATKDLISEVFSDLIAAEGDGKEGAGAGSGGKGNEGKGGKGGAEEGASWKSIKLPESIKSKVMLTDYLALPKEKNGPGLDPSSTEFAQAHQELGKDLPLRG